MSSPQPAGETVNLDNDVKVAQFPHLVTLSTCLTLQNFHLLAFYKINFSLIHPAKQPGSTVCLYRVWRDRCGVFMGELKYTCCFISSDMILFPILAITAYEV